MNTYTTNWAESVDTFLSEIQWKPVFPTAVQRMAQSIEIRFPHGALSSLRSELLHDSTREHFAFALGHKRISPSGQEIIVVEDIMYPGEGDIQSANLFHVRPSRSFVRDALAYMQEQGFTAMVDVHTHPFANTAHFSGVDTQDERNFCVYLQEIWGDAMAYASIVIAQEEQSARLWRMHENTPQQKTAHIRTQTATELPMQKGDALDNSTMNNDAMQARSALALGVDTMRRIAKNELIVLAGVGGLGSIIAEELVRSGFSRIRLIDNDVLELSNLNRFAGGYYADAMAKRPKVDVVQEHLQRINPQVEVIAMQQAVNSPEATALMAAAQWIIVSTDTQSSRHMVQKVAFKYGVPFISAGVNITVASDEKGQHHMEDQSGEVILIRYGDGYCLHCLGRLDFNRIAAEDHPEPSVRQGLVQKGYVQGLDVKEPAVMPLNAIIASQAVHCLLTQYRQGATHAAVVVYEAHTAEGGRMFEDTQSALPSYCAHCGRYVVEEDVSSAA